MMQASITLRTEPFSVRLVEPPDLSGSVPSVGRAFGRITINDFSEIFEMNLSYWSVDRYMQSWCSAIKELDHSERATSCIVSSITDPANSNFFTCWPMYRDGGDVYVQNRLLFLEELDEEFDEEKPWRHMDPRSVVNEDGMRISEWLTGIDQVREFWKATWGDE